MGYHSFSLDPRTVLGVSLTASLDEIHEAFRSKSKKHHPDLGGDEWAFRMVARAYEVLKTTMTMKPSQPWENPASDSMNLKSRPSWSWIDTPSRIDQKTCPELKVQLPRQMTVKFRTGERTSLWA